MVFLYFIWINETVQKNFTHRLNIIWPVATVPFKKYTKRCIYINLTILTHKNHMGYKQRRTRQFQNYVMVVSCPNQTLPTNHKMNSLSHSLYPVDVLCNKEQFHTCLLIFSGSKKGEGEIQDGIGLMAYSQPQSPHGDFGNTSCVVTVSNVLI